MSLKTAGRGMADPASRLLKPAIMRLYTYLGRRQNDPWIEAASHWVERNIMQRRRQRRRQKEQQNPDIEAYLKGHFCANPFTTLETTHQGLAYVCCPIWLPTPIGKLDSDPEELWSGETAQKLRESIIDGSFAYCSRVHCSAIANRSLPSRDSREVKDLLAAYLPEKKAAPPKRVVLSHDKSCNLTCPSCRAVMITADKAKQSRLDGLIERVIVPLLRDAEAATITGSGDPFGSNHFRNLIKRITRADQFPHLKINLQTNGQLWDRRAWQELGLSGRVRYAQISIDATRPDTYAFVRRGGSFERLLKNLEFVRELRRSGELAELEFSMVVQARNFREIPDFIQLGADYAADMVSFQMIRKRDIFSGDEHKEAFIGSPQHPDYEEFVALLRQKDLIAPRPGGPDVHMGNVLDYVRRAGPHLHEGADVRDAAE
jgi:wyosine [tRNA(Phe)-imidazoG37] synthetase (radical SAM superfamily)